ncbi:hypothetical protein GCM10020358_37840 [Amorphoplanes nipponensis]|uniref:Uncharacterized protein n=1 Tax=Actinoplanes nipponensis TaxID=135950 RepID=A0A919JKW8_9ACTN|nr:hypothetical protein [Actinoplanes nipponensis]GIE52451.1 hypothetical protein Ani05nite_59850 [Actinoplanes nipponensis]
MTTAAWFALGIAVFGAICYAAGSILQAVGARRSTTTVRALGHPLYLIGVGLDILSFVGSMVALRELAVYLVESVLASSLAITVVAARIFLRARLRTRDLVAVVVSVGALTVLAMSAGPQEEVAASTGLRLALCSAAAGLAVIGWATARISGSPGAVAALAGLSLGGAALAGRALPMQDPAALVTEPLLWALIVFAVGGMLLYTHALQHGAVGPVTAVLWIAEVIAPSAVALLVLGDAVRPGWELPALVAGLVTVGMAVLLAGASAQEQPTGPEAIEAAPAPLAIAAAAQPAPEPHAERVIWWGAPPIWKPPQRAAAAEPMAQLGWYPPPRVAPIWTQPRRPDRDAVPARAAEPAAPRQRPWYDVTEPAEAEPPVTRQW